jgi:2-polyprenyl-3-methyl-5-hydroxy-6-metoxy-1,4-benzoquinol methylase
MVSASSSITASRARPEPDRAPELTVDALMARMRVAAERAAPPAVATRAPGQEHGNQATDDTQFMQLQVEFNQALVAAINSITLYLKQSRDYSKSTSAKPTRAKPAAERHPVADLAPRLESLAAQVNELAQRLDQANAALDAADQSQRTLIDASSAQLETLCQMAAAAQQQAAAQVGDFQQRIAANEAAVEQIHHELAASERRRENKLVESDIRLLRLERELRKRGRFSPATNDPQRESSAPQQPTGTPDVPFDYFLFEHRFRGSTEEIKQRQQAYLDYFLTAESVLDLGCGRGEFVELLVERDVQVIGVDMNDDMVDFCKARGLPVTQGDLFEHLATQPDGALGGIFCSQVVEHLPADRVWKLIQLAAQKLKTDGILLLETINPHCLPAMNWFYLDPTHVRPYPPALLAFMCQQAGLRLECVQCSAPLPSATTGPFLKSSQDVPPPDAMHYQDYAVIARRIPIPL